MACAARIKGNAKSDGDSRIQTLNDVDSSQMKNGSSTAGMLYRYGRNHEVLETYSSLCALACLGNHLR